MGLILTGKILPFKMDTGARFTTLNGHVSAADLSETAAVAGLVVGFSGQSQYGDCRTPQSDALFSLFSKLSQKPNSELLSFATLLDL